jgi:gamma-glutamyltranspeptidase/glutathione hydrolase
MLEETGGFAGASPENRAHMLAEMSMRAYGERTRWMRPDGSTTENIADLITSAHLSRLAGNFDVSRHLDADRLNPPPQPRPENPSATSIVVVDSEGSAAACALTMNNAFGTGRFAGDTGILLAAIPDGAGRGPVSLGPMIVVRHLTNQFLFAGAAGGSASVPGGVAAPTALVNVAARTVLAEEPLDQAIAARRVHHGGNPDLTYHEPGVDAQILQGLRAKGHRIAATRNLGLVNAVSCPGGLPREPETCAVRTDPRGSGFAVSLER